jgi:hypothetical protein
MMKHRRLTHHGDAISPVPYYMHRAAKSKLKPPDGCGKIIACSIWICPYARNGENTVTTYDIRENKVFGSSDTPSSVSC